MSDNVNDGYKIRVLFNPYGKEVQIIWDTGHFMEFKSFIEMRGFGCYLIEEANGIENYVAYTEGRKSKRKRIPKNYAKKAIEDLESQFQQPADIQEDKSNNSRIYDELC